MLLLDGWGLWKSVRFADPIYIGSPINAVRVFNGFNVDELVILDIAATGEGRGPGLDVISQMTEGAFMPIAVGGGIRDVETMQRALDSGADRVVVNTAAVEEPGLLAAAAERFGSQCVVASIDVRRVGEAYEVFTRRAARATGLDPVEHARRLEQAGVGEVLLTSVDRDGTFEGYDVELTRRVSDAIGIPVIACGGAGSTEHLGAAVRDGHAAAVAAGARFVFYGPRRAVLINYPTDDELVRHLGRERTRRRAENPPCSRSLPRTTFLLRSFRPEAPMKRSSPAHAAFWIHGSPASFSPRTGAAITVVCTTGSTVSTRRGRRGLASSAGSASGSASSGRADATTVSSA